MRIEPPVSEPSAIGTSRAPTAEPEPDDEPPVMRERVPRIAHIVGVHVVPGRAVGELDHVDARRAGTSRPLRAARPRSRSRARSSPCGSSSRIRRACPSSSTCPCARPARRAADPSPCRRASARSAAFAAFSASSASTRANALSAGCHLSMRASSALVTSTEETLRRRIAAARSFKFISAMSLTGPASFICTTRKLDGSVSSGIAMFSAV